MTYRIHAVILGAAMLLLSSGVAEARRPTNMKQLQKRAMRAIKKNRPSRYVRLLLTPKDVKRHCPEKPLKRKRYARLVRKTRRSVRKCHRMLNWKRAKLVRVKTNPRRRQVKRCSGKVFKLRDIRLDYRVGAKVVRVTLDDPLQMGRYYVFSDDPRCRVLPARP